MKFLDSTKNYLQHDPDKLYDSISKFGRQIESGWHAAEFVDLGFDPLEIDNIVFTGMGGSNLAAEITHAIAPFLLMKPFELVANYRLPAYVSKRTLVILSSYSGDTEEIISCAQEAIAKNCRTICITTGGALRDLALKEHLALIELDEKYNPSRAPRAGICLSLGAVLSLLVRLNPIAKSRFNLKEIAETIDRLIDMNNIHKNTLDNPAKSLAEKHKGLGLIFLSANHLSGLGKIFSNYLNETAKTYGAHFNFPDLDHHLLDGLTYPSSLKENLTFLILNSSHFPETIQKRVQITREILIKQKYQVTLIKPEATDPILQVFESLAFLIMFSYYLGILNKVNPATNPWVDYLKKQL